MIFNPKIAFMGAVKERTISEWSQFGKNAAHNMVVEQAPVDSSPNTWELRLVNQSNRSNMHTVMHTLNDGKTYAYHVNQASNSAIGFLYCFVCGEDGYLFAKSFSGAPGLLAAPFLEKDAIWICESSLLRRYIGIHKQPILDKELSLDGPGSTPITKLGDYLYVGTSNGHYYQIDPETMNYKVCSVGASIIESGAVSDGTNVYFGSDNGRLYWRSIADFDTTGGMVDLTEETNDAGDMRSTIMIDEDGYLYFTTYGGYLWCFETSTDEAPIYMGHFQLEGVSTSTPTKVGDRIYVGYKSYYSGASGGVQCLDLGTGSLSTVVSGFPVTSSITVMGDGAGTDYLYFNTNKANGAGYCYSFDGAFGSQVWGTQGNTYGQGGVIIDNGYAVFGDDFDVHVVSDRS